VFVADSQGVRPLVIYNYEADNSSFEGHPAILTNYYNAQGVDVSSNGMYISVLAQRICEGYTVGLCESEQQSTVYNALGQTALTTAGPVILSPGGTWALVPMQPLDLMPFCVLYNLTTGAFTGPLAGGVPHSCYDVADDGTVLISGVISGLSILQNGLSTPISGATGQILAARMDSSAAVVVWEQLDASGSTSLHSVRTNNVMNPVSLGVSSRVDSQPQLSDDGSTAPGGSNSRGDFASGAFRERTDRLGADADGATGADRPCEWRDHSVCCSPGIVPQRRVCRAFFARPVRVSGRFGDAWGES
jgi:hypothetical protein